MKTLGIVGGIGPESTVEYYRSVLRTYRERHGDEENPPIIIDSIDVRRVLRLTATDTNALRSYLLSSLTRLSDAGANLAIVAANTPHIVFDDLSRDSPIPLISIVEATCERAQELGLRRVGLLGTRFTMRGKFYDSVFGRAGIAVVPPTEDEQAYLHDKYTTELIRSIFTRQTRSSVLRIISRLKERDNAEAIILGGTEFPLLLTDLAEAPLPLLDTTEIHARAASTMLWP